MTCPKDGSTNINRPATRPDWANIGLRVPRQYVRTDAAGPNLVDDIVGVTWTAQGAPAMQQAIEAGYAAKGVAFTDGTSAQGFSVPAGAVWNELTQAVMVYLRFQVVALPAAGLVRSLFTLVGTTSCHFGLLNSTGTKATVRGTGTPTGFVNGTVAYGDGHLHGVILTTIPQTPILGHGTVAAAPNAAGIFEWASDKERLNASFPFAPDFQKGCGAAGAAALFTPSVLVSDWAVWTGSDAEYQYNTVTAKGVLQAFGWTVTGY